MANKKYATGFPPVVIANLTDALQLVQGSTDGKATLQQLLNLFATSFGNVSLSANANSTLQLDVTNLNTGSSAKSQVNIGVGAETSGDPTIAFFINGGQLITMGLDNSDLNAFVISNTNALGTGNIFKVDQSGNVTIPGSLDSSGNEMSVSWNANSTAQITVYNASNTASAKAQFNAMVQGASAGDPTISFSINGSNLFTVGLDNSDSDAFVISNTGALGTGNIFRIGQDGTPSFPLIPLGLTSGGTGSATASGARTNLGLGTAAVVALTTLLQVANNLSDLANTLTARTNLGLNGTRAISGTTDTLVLTDVDKFIRTTNGSATTITVPTNASVAFPAGAKIYIMQGAAGQVTIAPVSGAVTILNDASALKLLQNTVVTLIQTDVIDTWVVSGNTV